MNSELADAISHVHTVKESLDKVSTCFQPAFAAASATDASDTPRVDFKTLRELVKPYEAASAEIAFAYSLAILYHTSLNLKGGVAPTHPIFLELQRIQQHIGRLVEAKQALENKKPPKRKIVVDKEASRRVIMHKLAENEL
jgi:hypothetical protein